MNKYNFTESDFEYLHEVFGIIWNDDGEPYLNGINRRKFVRFITIGSFFYLIQKGGKSNGIQ